MAAALRVSCCCEHGVCSGAFCFHRKLQSAEEGAVFVKEAQTGGQTKGLLPLLTNKLTGEYPFPVVGGYAALFLLKKQYQVLRMYARAIA